MAGSGGMIAYVLESPGARLVRRERPLPEPGEGEVRVRVAACGLCHTDYGYARDKVPTRKPAPIVLGHEIAGYVEAGGAGIKAGTPVLVPAVIPCGQCEFCRHGRGNACPKQKMPGNDIDGGFATHVIVPAHGAIDLTPYLGKTRLDAFAVIADAASTALQAVNRAGVAEGDIAVIVGAGGVGGFALQIARAKGARVAAVDVNPETLRHAASAGAHVTYDAKALAPKQIREAVRAELAKNHTPSFRLKIFETSGSPEGQVLAFGLLERAATLAIVGYTPQSVTLRLSNVMAFDATVFGTWGCRLENYPEILAMAGRGDIAIEPVIERAPMSKIDDFFDAMAAHTLHRRMVLDPLQ